ncbi:MAG: UDP-glucose--hexose-1-phosphate uridylyltransferase [Alphaproteobacteria bacterium]|nr:UDP-glucose--hexose-1-phosphate uridylyltransferase [Alphaproteobacteria bacterium]
MTLGSHRRRNLLTGAWVLVSPHRMARPWLGESTPPAAAPALAHDPACTLCAGVTRASGIANPAYDGVYVFDNDFPALSPGDAPGSDDLFETAPANGVCRVICYGPDHGRHLARMPHADIEAVVACWATETRALFARPGIAAVTIFENRGAMMGASNPHPHGQIWATDWVPDELAKECAAQRAHADCTGRPLLLDVLARERAEGARLVVEGAHFTALVPFWATWPFETLILPHRAVARLDALDAAERADLADVLRRLVARYDALFAAPFPYSFGFHQAPAGAAEGFVLHAHVYPPLLRSASVRKHMVGFEMLGEPQRDLTPEAAAARLRDLPEA